MVAAFCALVVVLMRTGVIASTISYGDVSFPMSDFFVIVGAGLCGYRYGLGLFLVIYIAELTLRNHSILHSFALFIYLAVALLSGIMAQRGWYRKKSLAFAGGIVIEAILSGLLFFIYSYIFRISWTSVSQSLMAPIPEILVAVAFLYFYYNHAPDSFKMSFGLEHLYIKENADRDTGPSALGRQITALSIAVSLIFGVIAALLTNEWINVLAGEKCRFILPGIRDALPDSFSRTMLVAAGFLLGWMLSLSVIVIVNEIIIGNIIKIVREQGQLETALAVSRAGSEAKSAFLSSMSHEIRTPINAVLGMDEMILRESRERKTLEYAENIQAAGNTLLSLINDVLDLYKIEAGKMEIIPVEYNPASMIHDLVTMIHIRAQKKGLRLIADVAGEIPSRMYGDEIRIKQVITNILTNAVKYTERGSVTLKISTRKEDTGHVMLKVSVRDTGIGIREEDIQKLFSAFERIEEERNRNIEGTGLGMNITTRLLDMMGSELQVSSVYGEGSEFSFELLQEVLSWAPAGDYEKAWKESVKVSPRYRASFTAPAARILAVDDASMNLSVLAGLLKQTKVQVDTAGSGEECLERIKGTKYDIILLDHRMPGMDGMETRKRMDGLPGNLNGDTPVIALTANASAGVKEEYLKYGFSDYLSKPINGARLEQMVRVYLPAEKVQENTEGIFQEPLPEDDEYPQIDGLDWEYAKLHLPEDGLLRTAFTDFYNCIEPQAERLEELYQNILSNHAFADYRIQVHGMKSSAATIGIIPLAGMAKELENAASREDKDTVMGLNPIFLEAWRGYKTLLKGLFGLGSEDTESGREFDDEAILGYLEAIHAAMEDFDVDRADEAMKDILSISCPDAIRKEVEKLKDHVSNVDGEGCFKDIEKIKGLLGKGA